MGDASADNAVPIVGDVNRTNCYLVNYTPINNTTSNGNNKWISSVLSYNRTTKSTSSGGNRQYYWSQSMYCYLFGQDSGNCDNCDLSKANPACAVASVQQQCIFDPKNPSCGCLFYSPSDSCGNSPITLHINDLTNDSDTTAGQITQTSLSSGFAVVPLILNIKYINSSTILSFNDTDKDKTVLYLSINTDGDIIDTTSTITLTASSTAYKLSNTELWTSAPVNLNLGIIPFVPKLGEYARDCVNTNNLSYYDYYKTINYGPDGDTGVNAWNKYLSTIYFIPTLLYFSCDTADPTSSSIPIDIKSAAKSLETYVTSSSTITSNVARWASSSSCSTQVRFLYCGNTQNCGDSALDFKSNKAPCNGFCTIPAGGTGTCKFDPGDGSNDYNYVCVTSGPAVPWYKKTTVLAIMGGLTAIIIIGIIAIIIYIHHSHTKTTTTVIHHHHYEATKK